jgi:hypothetical protein
MGPDPISGARETSSCGRGKQGIKLHRSAPDTVRLAGRLTWPYSTSTSSGSNKPQRAFPFVVAASTCLIPCSRQRCVTPAVCRLSAPPVRSPAPVSAHPQPTLPLTLVDGQLGMLSNGGAYDVRRFTVRTRIRSGLPFARV